MSKKTAVVVKYDPERDMKIRVLADQVVELAREVMEERSVGDAYTRRELVARITEVIERTVNRL